MLYHSYYGAAWVAEAASKASKGVVRPLHLLNAERPKIRLRGLKSYRKELSFLLDLSKPDDIRTHALELAEKGKFDQALYLYQEAMPTAGKAPEVYHWIMLMKVVGRHGSPFDALRVFEAITFAGLDPDLVAFITIVTIFCKHRLVDEAISMVRRMTVEFGMKPTLAVLSPILQELARRGEPLQIEKMLRSAQEQFFITPDAVTVSLLIQAHTKAGSIDKALQIISQLPDATLSDEILCLEILRGMLLRKSSLELVTKFWELLKTRRTGATVGEYGMLMRIFESARDWQSVLRLFREMLERKKNVQTCIHLQYGLRACLALKQYQQALKLWVEFFEFQWHLEPDSMSYALLTRLTAELRNVDSLTEIILTCIPDNLATPIDLILLRVFYGCLVVLRIESASDYERHRAKLWESCTMKGSVRQCSPAVAFQTRAYVLKRLEEFKSGMTTPIKDSNIIMSTPAPEDETDAGEVDF